MSLTQQVYSSLESVPGKQSRDARAGRKIPSPFHNVRPLLVDAPLVIAAAEIPDLVEAWLLDCASAQHTRQSRADKTDKLAKFQWFLREKGFTECGPDELRRFFSYLANGHLEPGGKWGNAAMVNPVRPITAKGYYTVLQSFFNYLIRNRKLHESPLQNVTRPIARPDQIEPFSREEIEAILGATSQAWHPSRDRAIVLVLLDTGIRATELCNLKYKDFDSKKRCLTVLGKGNKYRVLPLGKESFKALWGYVSESDRKPLEALFQCDRGKNEGGFLNRCSVHRIITDLCDSAGLYRRKRGPHTFRHTFAIMFLRARPDVFALQQMLGHESLSVTRRYAALAQTDVFAAHGISSPADSIFRAVG